MLYTEYNLLYLHLYLLYCTSIITYLLYVILTEAVRTIWKHCALDYFRYRSWHPARSLVAQRARLGARCSFIASSSCIFSLLYLFILFFFSFSFFSRLVHYTSEVLFLHFTAWLCYCCYTYDSRRRRRYHLDSKYNQIGKFSRANNVPLPHNTGKLNFQNRYLPLHTMHTRLTNFIIKFHYWYVIATNRDTSPFMQGVYNLYIIVFS